MLHNVKVVQREGKEPIIVPYDFDSAGLVNAAYARPNPDYAQMNVRDRVFMHRVEQLKELRGIIRYMDLNKKEIKQIVKDCKLLTRANRRDVLDFLSTFFEIMNNSTLAEGEFVKKTQ